VLKIQSVTNNNNVLEVQIKKRRDWFTMDYFDNLDNESLNKYKKKFKNGKKFMD
jgi:hypothetical protein